MAKSGGHLALKRRRAKSIAVVIAALSLIAIIIWVDLTTGLWNDLVVIAGLASGLVSFLLTALVFNKIIARATERRWAPVKRLALLEFLHAIADEERSEISRGRILPRLLPTIVPNDDVKATRESLHALRELVVQERRQLSETLSRWAEFLASSSSNELILQHIAAIAFQLDQVRDATVEVEQQPSAEAIAELKEEIRRCNTAMLDLEAELKAQVDTEDRLMQQAR